MEKKKPCILVVDDETSNIDVLNGILRPDYEVYAAKNGVTAIRMATEQLPDLILLDVLLPGMDGFDLLYELKNTEATQSIPVIIITGLGSIEDEEKGFALGAVDYIIKPFSPNIVKARIRNHMQLVEQLRTIERLSRVDELTGLPNRRSFNELLVREWARAIRDNSPISMLMIDVDRFKDYNDKYGHIQGDILLSAISGIFLRSLRRATDLVARWGGEEFTVLLPETCSDGAKSMAEMIRAGIEAAIVHCENGDPTHVTVSVGVNTEYPTSADPVSRFISRADDALYAAKAAGRNKVCVYKEQ